MKEPKGGGRKAVLRPPRIIRQYETLTPEETEDVVETVADLIVNFVQKRGLDSEVTADGQDSREARGRRPARKAKRRR